MGLLSDTLEDNRERYAVTTTLDFQPIESPPERLPDVACPACDRVFGSELALKNHITKEHARSHVYVKANSRIVRSTDVISDKARSCELILLGVKEVSVTLECDSRISRFRTKTAINLLEYFPAGYSGEVRLCVEHNRVRKDFLIYFDTNPPFNQSALDAAVIDLQKCLERGSDPDWTAFQHQIQQTAQNDLERRYLEGFLEYSLGFHLERRGRWRDSGSHLESAMQMLSPYATPLARTARRVLAIRMNCFTPLARCHANSIFHLARSFFVDGKQEHPGDFAGQGVQNEQCVYVDGFTEQLLVALKAFYARDFTNVLTPIDSLSRHPLADDKNNEDKLHLLKARTSKLAGDKATAGSSYRLLLDHPLFGREAQSYIDGMRA